ncbi:hypothetical protein E4T44_05629 [Aureobasidium sp. EXF-8845]|nr:hypothetical protein E4T44_05629 [Aureobasidium sp. EXF-8845]KAI4850268.1 hypothetical protein E4T45_05567 [Aureobasidium sp. EXF-8846]
MAKGSCLCGDVTFEYQGEPAAKAACHCIPCRKTSGTTNSYNLMIPTSNYKVLSGDLKTFNRKGDSGKNLTYYYCKNCPTILYVQAEAMDGVNIVKMGTLDDEDVYNNLGKPGMEIYTRNRPVWCQAIPGAEQKEGGS